MKFKKLLLLLSCSLFIQFSFAQFTSKSDCPNYNKFELDASSILKLEGAQISRGMTNSFRFDSKNLDRLGGINELVNILDSESRVSFIKERTTSSRGNPNVYFDKYQQYFEGVKVDGGGFSLINSPKNPCSDETRISMSTNIYSNISIDTKSNIQVNAIEGILQEYGNNEKESRLKKLNRSELVISTNLKDECQYYLVWKVHYNTNEPRIAWINAHTGEVLKSVSEVNYLTSNFKCKNEIMSRANLIPPPNIVNFYFANSVECTGNADDLINELEPLAVNEVNDEILENTECIFEAFDQLGIDFGTVDILFGCSDSGARSDGNTNGTKLWLGVEPIGGQSLVVADVIAHELSHAIINDYFSSSDNGIETGTLHEAIADMFGVYAESNCQGGDVDWVMSDDNFWNLRDLENPRENCFSIAKDFKDAYDRGGPLRNWFYLITEGDTDNDIPALGIETAMNIVMDALELFEPGDVLEFTSIIELSVEEIFGNWSTESKAVKNALSATCLGGDGFDGPRIIGPYEVCEENENSAGMLFRVDGEYGDLTRWYFPIDWTIAGNGYGNTHNSTFLKVLSWPKYDYYPQTFEICFQTGSPNSSMSSVRICRDVTLEDCDGDDPTCEEYYEKTKVIRMGTEMILSNLLERSESYAYVFNALGIKVFEGNLSEFQRFRNNQKLNQVSIVYFMDKKGNITNSFKYIK